MEIAELVGESTAVRDLRQMIESVAQTDARILITGENGVGKEVVAKMIHQQSRRRAAKLVTLNCASVPDSLLESELFGHVRGSFTAAYRDKPGLLELANNGTIFLDEIGEASLRVQALLLRFLENGEVWRIGADRLQTTSDVRVIAATNRNLREDIAQGQFREDLFYRLSVVPITIPALRDRPEDIPALLEWFWQKLRSEAFVAADDAMEALVRYSWPGNVQELKNVVEQLSVSTDRPVQLASLPPEIRRVIRHDIPTDFEIRFSPEFSPDEVKGLLTALSEYYRACGGVGLAMTFEAEHVEVEEPTHA
jgi:two-component system nitrogen regulation response regulator NtrX